MKRLIKLPGKGRAIIAGDTHGDIEASRLIIKNYAKRNYYIVFLGDYVDRGCFSRENVDYLLESREKYPRIILLAGNHEMFDVVKVTPADFWEHLCPADYEHYAGLFRQLPLAVEGKGFIALHGVLPDIQEINDFEDIQDGDENWHRVVWGDFREKEGENLGKIFGRTKFGKNYFSRVMHNLSKNVLIRSHDPVVSESIFDHRCLTLFTSSAYGGERKIAVLNLAKETKTIDDIEIIRF